MPPCGGHPVDDAITEIADGFKSCPRVGGIALPYAVSRDAKVSSRAPVWGASNEDGDAYRKTVVSSRAPVWGASIQRFEKMH